MNLRKRISGGLSALAVAERANTPSAHLFAVAATLAAMGLLLMLPTPAFAFDFVEDVVGNISSALLAPMIASLSTLADEAFDKIANIGMMDSITSGESWEELLPSVYAFINTSQRVVLLPAAMQILTLVFMFKLLGIGRIAESSDMQPLVTRVVITCIGFFFMAFVVQHASAIITVGYELMQSVLNSLTPSEGILDSYMMKWDIEAAALEGAIPNLTSGFTLSICYLLLAIFGFVAYLVAAFCYYSKIIKLYLFAFFAPIPLAMAGLDSTRSWTLGFIKSVAATLLSLVIMYFILKLFPHLVSTVIANTFPDAASTGFGNWLVSNMTTPFAAIAEMLVLCLLLIFFMIRSSSIARDILGG